MQTQERVTIRFVDGGSHSFVVTDGNGELYAVSIETGGYGVRMGAEGPMVWHTPADVERVDVVVSAPA